MRLSDLKNQSACAKIPNRKVTEKLQPRPLQMQNAKFCKYIPICLSLKMCFFYFVIFLFIYVKRLKKKPARVI